MVRDLNVNLEVVGCPTIREEDGLAKSSRNTYLGEEERVASRVLSRALRLAQDAYAAGEDDAAKLTRIMEDELKSEPMAEIDYIEIVDGLSIQPIEKLREGDLVAMAVRIGTTRLIDNFIAGDPLIPALAK